MAVHTRVCMEFRIRAAASLVFSFNSFVSFSSFAVVSRLLSEAPCTTGTGTGTGTGTAEAFNWSSSWMILCFKSTTKHPHVRNQGKRSGIPDLVLFVQRHQAQAVWKRRVRSCSAAVRLAVQPINSLMKMPMNSAVPGSKRLRLFQACFQLQPRTRKAAIRAHARQKIH